MEPMNEQTPEPGRAPGSSTSGGGDLARSRRRDRIPPELARRLEATRDQITRELRTRDRLILEALDAGGSLREIAELSGLTHAGVRWVERRHRQRDRG